MKKILIVILLLHSTLIFSQKEANIWYFGEFAGLDFNSGIPVPLTDGQLNTDEGCASISDENGNLLFYTDGGTVYNKAHKIMLNGTGLNGHYSSTNSALIVPKPGDTNVYFIFTVDAEAGINGLQYSEVNMSLDSGFGGITSSKNILLHTRSTENITAIKKPNISEYWVVAHKWESNEFTAYKVSNLGVSINPVISSLGDIITWPKEYSQGSLKISPNGKKIVIARRNNHGLGMYDFNYSTGIISNPVDFNITYYGLEFSPNSKILYATDITEGLFQFNLEAGTIFDIINSKITLAERDVSNDAFGAIQLATDGRIYLARDRSEYLDVIKNPDIIGLGSNYQLNSVFLGGKKSRLGLPPFIQSYFKIDDFTFENLCFGDTTQFNITDTVDSAIWDFGDVASGVNNTSTVLAPTHLFSSPGDYEVTVTVKAGSENSTTTSTVTIYNVPTATKPTDIKICDTNNDGFYAVDLTDQKTTILNGQDPLIFDVKYYAGFTNFTNGTEISLPNSYTNQTAYTLETIFVKVSNKNNASCFDSTDFTIQVFETPIPNTAISPLTECDNSSFGSDTDNIILFDLTQKETDILSGQSTSNFTVLYYTDAGFSAQIANPAAFQNTTNPQTIYVKMLNNTNSSCVGATKFNLEVFSLPTITSSVVLKQCDNADINGFSAFNLEEVNTKISLNALNENITFFTSYVAAANNNSSEKIINPTTYLNPTVSNSKVWARVENTNNCFRISEIDLIVSTTQIPSSFQKSFYECDDFVDPINNETDGISTFNFSTITSEIENIFPIGQQLIINYYRNESDALAEINPITDISNYRNIGYPTTQIIYVRVDSKLDNDCLGLGGHITLNVEPIPIANTVTIARQCDDDFDVHFTFDTSTIETTVLSGQTGMLVSYFDKNGNALPSPLPNPFLTPSQIITIRVTSANSKDVDGACFAETTLEFIVDKKPVANSIADLMECDDDLDGIFSFNTSTIETAVLKGQTGMIVSYFDENGVVLPSPLPNPFLTGSKTITAMVKNQLNSTCISQTSFDFIVHPKPEFELNETDIVCLNVLPKQLSIFNPKETNYTFMWTDANGTEVGNQPSIEITKGGIYTVVATSIIGCKSFPQDIEVFESNIAVLNIGQIKITDDSENNMISIETHQLGIGDYEFAIQKAGESIGFYQDDPIFENVGPGIYTVYVNDKNNCGTINFDVSVIGYPKFFTPNNDGYNDYWNVIGVNSNFFPNSLIYIFDRFGKLVTTIDPSGNGWGGLYKGVPLPSSDYWFTVELIDDNGNRKVRKGHFSLIRK